MYIFPMLLHAIVLCPHGREQAEEHSNMQNSKKT